MQVHPLLTIPIRSSTYLRPSPKQTVGSADFDLSDECSTTALPLRERKLSTLSSTLRCRPTTPTRTRAGASYQHDFSREALGGRRLQLYRSGFRTWSSRSGIQTITGFVSYQLSPSMYVTGWVGPEYTANKDIVPTFCFPGFGCFGYHAVHQAEWNVAEGATFGWSEHAERGCASGFRHQVSDGGGLLGTVQLYQVTADLPAATDASAGISAAGISYNNSLSISQYHANQFLKSLQGTCEFQPEYLAGVECNHVLRFDSPESELLFATAVNAGSTMASELRSSTPGATHLDGDS